MYRLIAIDLDDTLLSDDLSIHPDNLRTLRQAKQKGVYVVLCSGRESLSMENIMEKTGLFTEEDYFISYNGAVVQTVGGTVLWRDEIKGEALRKMIAIARRHQVIVQCYCDGLTVDQADMRINQYEVNTGVVGKVVPDLMELPYSIKILFNSLNRKALEAVRSDLEAEFGEEYHYFFSKPEYLEVVYKTSNKGLAVKYLAEHLKIAASEVICIGDSFNDAYMIEYAGLGVAMKNANPKVQEMADVVTEKTNNEGGVAEIVEKYILNESGH